MKNRARLGLAVFVIGTAACVLWAYSWVAPVVAPTTGRGGIGFVSVNVLVLAAALFVAVGPPFLTFRLTGASGARGLGTAWRRVHVVAVIALVSTFFFGSIWSFVAVALFLPLQAFFAIGALAIWIAYPATRPIIP